MVDMILNDVDVNFEVETEQQRTIKSALASLLRSGKSNKRIVRALQSVTISINAGEKVGIIGPNGAGKSTLLKVMAGIYPPHNGEVEVEGHVCPLFEFATGFEMEANGWENIRTRALLLGMSMDEIEQKIEEIGYFSELGDFLDIPVRTYSSGMLLRLAFATSTAVDPDILLLDEVMAAGDAAFIQQARTRMDRMVAKANIVVFATHSLGMLPSFCERSIWLNHGQVMMDGPSDEVVEAYRISVSQLSGEYRLDESLES